MLSKITSEEFHQYLDFAYELAMDPARSGYPTYTDRIKTKEDFIRVAQNGLSGEHDQILLYRREGSVEGWIHYFWEPEDKYLQTCVFNIRKDTDTAMEEFLRYLAEHFPGYHAYLGFPGENQEAIKSLYAQGFACDETSYNNSLFFDTFELLPAQGDVRRIQEENYQDFRILHAPYDAEMYWDSDHILGAISQWHIHVCYQNQLPVGAIYVRYSEPMLEIYGVDFSEDRFDEAVYRALLTQALNDGKLSGARYMTYFTEEKQQPIALDLGFHCVGKYLCFDKQL